MRFLYLLYSHESSKLFADPHSFTANFMAPLAALAVAGTLAWLRNCTPLSRDFQLRLGLSVSVLEPACSVGKLLANTPDVQKLQCFRWIFDSLDVPTSSTAQGGGGSFKNRKPIGEVRGRESGMAERSHCWTERRLISLSLFL